MDIFHLICQYPAYTLLGLIGNSRRENKHMQFIAIKQGIAFYKYKAGISTYVYNPVSSASGKEMLGFLIICVYWQCMIFLNINFIMLHL
jgi:hypothetical protein